MKVELELWQLITLAIMLATSFAGLGKLLLMQVERNLRSDIHRISNDSAKWRELELNFYKHLAELPVAYVRREDYARGQAVLEAKSDAIAAKVERLQIMLGGQQS